MDAGVLNVVEIGQYFMTKDTAEFSQFTDAVACREYTLPRDEGASEPKGWIRGNTKIGPVLEVATCSLHGKYGVEIRIMSMNKDNSHSWVRISHGVKKLVTNLNNKEQEIPEMQFEDYALKLNASGFASRPKAKAKPQRRKPAGSSTRAIPIGERIWTDIAPGEYSISDYEVSKKLIRLLRHGSLPRDNDGAIEFWRLKDYLQNHFVHSRHWSDEKWKSIMAKGGGNKYFSIVLILPEKSCTSELFKVIQDADSLILHYRIMYWFQTISSSTFFTLDVHQFTFHHKFRIDTGRAEFEQKTDSILFACGSHGQRTQRSWDNRPESTTSCSYMQTAWKKTSEPGFFGSTSILHWRKDWSSIKHDRMLSFFTKHSQLIVFRKLLGWKLEKSYTRKYLRHLGFLRRSPWNMTGWKNWVQKLLDIQKEKLFEKQKVSN